MSFLLPRALPTPQIWQWAHIGIICLLVPNIACQLNNETSPTHSFKSRPDLHAPILDLQILEPDLITPGYIFLAPYRNLDPGPYIYDNDGQLVWSGAGEIGPATAHTPRVCQYKGEDHLCFFTGEQHQGFARGHGVIMDKHYRAVRQIDSAGAGASGDMHEFKMTPHSDGTTVLMTIYQPRQFDVTSNPWWNLQNGMGWIVEGVFQEVDIETGQVIFEWRSLDHIDPREAWTLPMTTDTSGTGMSELEPWDYFHLNSIDKNEDGDYLISARHVSAIYKISGRDGGIIWQLGGNTGHFRQTNFNFSYQHHARWMSENATHTILSFFDNASNNYNGTGLSSHGWIVSIDHLTQTATMIKEFGAPEPSGGLLSTSQGNMQMLPSGGCHIGWGEHAYFSEHTASGQAVMYGKVATRASNVMIYRSNKYNWTAQPITKPALWTFSKQGAEHMAFWVSWNGATEVRSWRFYIGDSAQGPWKFVAKVWKTGFETEHRIDRFARWAYAEAVDGGGNPLEASVIARTFVPSSTLRALCDDRGCKYADPVPPEQIIPYEDAGKIKLDAAYDSTNRGFDTAHYYQNHSEDDKVNHDKSAQPYARVNGSSWWAAFAVGLISGALAMLLGAFGLRLSRCGGWRTIWQNVFKTSFGSNLEFGSYRAVGQRDVYGYESRSSRSSGPF